MKIQTKLAHSLISISRTQARVQDVSDKLHEMKLACLFVLLSRSRPRWGGKKKKDCFATKKLPPRLPMKRRRNLKIFVPGLLDDDDDDLELLLLCGDRRNPDWPILFSFFSFFFHFVCGYWMCRGRASPAS
jgi:hypothetical protein